MTASEYEQYVTEIVRQFDFCKQAKITNNRKFRGKRQPGKYEIDIAVEIRFSEVIYFLMIIECKHWNRPVDRPIIQNLAQTRDAISAHKAVLASTEGFSKEAVAVARAHGIALWRIPKDADLKGPPLYSVYACELSPPPVELAIDDIYEELRYEFLMATELLDQYNRYVDVNLYIKEIYLQITSYKDWQQTKGLLGLSAWKEHTTARLRSLGFSDRKVTSLLLMVVRDNQRGFRQMVEKRIVEWLMTRTVESKS